MSLDVAASMQRGADNVHMVEIEELFKRHIAGKLSSTESLSFIDHTALEILQLSVCWEGDHITKC